MKRLIPILTLIAMAAMPVLANITGNGYYRIRNFGSDRWATMITNTVEIDVTATIIDLYALQLNSDTEYIISDPGSIVYLTDEGSNRFDMAAQGTSLESMMDHAVNIRANGTAPNGQNLYMIYGTQSGVTKYIGDSNLTDAQIGNASSEVKPSDNYAKWYIMPVSVNSDNYFGVVPDVNAGGNLYTTLYASFPFQPTSGNVKAYYVGRVSGSLVEMIEITGDVPGATPVIIKCSGANSSDNKLQLLENSPAPLSENNLSGYYFNFYYSKKLNNRIVYDPETMRVLGACSDGSLGFITAEDLVSIPANSAYLKVEPGSPKELKCVDTADFNAGVESTLAGSNNLRFSNGYLLCDYPSEIIVYDLSGRKMAEGYGIEMNVSSLSKGVYIGRSGGKAVKFIVN